MKKILLYFNQCLGGNKIPSKTRREIRQEWKAKKAAKNLQNPSVDAINLDGKSQNDEVEAVSPASPTTKLGPGAVVVQPLSAKAKSAPALGEGNLENLNNNNNNSSNIPSIDQQLAVNNSIARLQALVRRFLTTRRFIHHWQSALQEADDYWLEIYWKKEEDRRKKMLAAKARKQVAVSFSFYFL